MSLLDSLTPYVQDNAPWKKGVWKALLQMGLPNKKWDAFKYSSLLPLNSASFKICSNNEIQLNISSAAGIIALPLFSAMRPYGALLSKSFQETLLHETNPYTLLNQAFADAPLFVYVPPGKKVEMEWTLPTFEQGAMHSPKVDLFVGKNAEVSIYYKAEGQGEYFYNQQLQMTLDEGASVTLLEHLKHSSSGNVMHSLRARLRRASSLKVTTISKGAKLERHDLKVSLEGEGSSVDLQGLSLPSRKEEIHHFLTVQHQAPKCHSNQHYKTLLRGSARSSFEGKIYVEREAQLTEAYQLNNNLILSPHAKAMSKPNLEIFADDVKASHGATCARPSEEELFYMRTRGLSKKEAEGQLAEGFCKEIVSEATLREFFQQESE